MFQPTYVPGNNHGTAWQGWKVHFPHTKQKQVVNSTSMISRSVYPKHGTEYPMSLTYAILIAWACLCLVGVLPSRVNTWVALEEYELGIYIYIIPFPVTVDVLSAFSLSLLLE